MEQIKMKQIILFGAGGHAAVILDSLKAQIEHGTPIEIKGLLDDSGKAEWMGYPILGTTDLADRFHDGQTEFVLAIGSNEVRERLARQYSHLPFYTVIHPTVTMGTNVTLGVGTVVMPNVVLNANTQVGCHAIINTGAIVEHDNRIGDYVHLSPNATLCGTVTVGDLTHIGAGATVIQGMTIGSRSIIGAGATVVNDLAQDVTAVGVPARVIKQRR